MRRSAGFCPRRLLVGLSLGILAAGVGLLGVPGPIARAQQVDRVGVVQRFFTAIGAGDLNGAVATFSEDALFVGGRSCTPPDHCNGREEIRAGLAGVAGNHISVTIPNPQVAGSVVFGEYELQDDTTVAAGVDRIERAFLAEVPEDRMTVFVSLNDLTDAQTAQYLGVAQAPAQLDRRGILDAWFQARSAGGVQTSAAGFTEDAFLVSAPPCGTDSPCVGIDAIRGRLTVPGQDNNRRYTLLGSAVVMQYEQASDALLAAGIGRIVVATIVQMPQQQMNIFVRVPDLTDPQTAGNAGLPPAPPN
jgi:ketosteroid isomerase-like protein